MSSPRVSQTVSKTQRKKASAELQNLGEKLIGLAPEELHRLDLPKALRDALELAARLSKHGAQRRQRQYIGRLMRDIDPAPIRAYLDATEATERMPKRRFREVEQWRDRLLEDDPSVLAECAVATGADVDRLRDLRRAVHHAHSDIARKTASRALFRYLFGVASGTTLPTDSVENAGNR